MDESKLAQLFADAFNSCAAPEEAAEIRNVELGKDELSLDVELVEEARQAAPGAKNVVSLIKDLKLPGKIKLALLGNQTARSLLIRDSNRLIPQFVLENPRLTEGEVYEFARNKDLDDAVIRTIANNGNWMKSYSIKSAVVFNPKTPLDVSIKWAKYIKEKELRLLAKSRNIPQALATQCRKLLEKRQG